VRPHLSLGGKGWSFAKASAATSEASGSPDLPASGTVPTLFCRLYEFAGLSGWLKVGVAATSYLQMESAASIFPRAC
jgi:hypothetical protein